MCNYGVNFKGGWLKTMIYNEKGAVYGILHPSERQENNVYQIVHNDIARRH